MPREIPLGGPDAIANETIKPKQIGESGDRTTVYADEVDAQSATGLAEVDDNGDILSSALPDLAITETYVVADKTERLNLSAQEGDIAIQQDTDETHIFAGGDPSNDADWSTFQSPAAPVQSVFGRTGDVTAQSGDYAASEIDGITVSAVLEGTQANRPTAGTAGRFYFETDTGIIYRDDGSVWQPWGGHGTSSDPVPGTTHLNAADVANQLAAGSVSTESLVIGGTLFEEDDNSPINVSSVSSTTYNVAGSYDRVVIIPDSSVLGFNELQVGGDTGTNYSHTDNSDTRTTGDTKWPLNYSKEYSYYELIADRDVQTVLQVQGGLSTGTLVHGSNSNVTGNIGQFTFSDSGGSNRDFKARVFGRDMGL